jgi:hypothetical protein
MNNVLMQLPHILILSSQEACPFPVRSINYTFISIRIEFRFKFNFDHANCFKLMIFIHFILALLLIHGFNVLSLNFFFSKS